MPETLKSQPIDTSKFALLAELLQQASLVAREISRESGQSRLEIPLLKRPQTVSKEDEWFWSPRWQTGEREVDEALARGEYQDFDTVEAAITALHQGV